MSVHPPYIKGASETVSRILKQSWHWNSSQTLILTTKIWVQQNCYIDRKYIKYSLKVYYKLRWVLIKSRGLKLHSKTTSPSKFTTPPSSLTTPKTKSQSSRSLRPRGVPRQCNWLSSMKLIMCTTRSQGSYWWT